MGDFPNARRLSGSMDLRTPTLFDLFFGNLAAWVRKRALLRKQPKPRSRALRFESLEPRLLLSADLSYSAGAGALDATLRIIDDAGPVLQLVDNATHSELARTTLSVGGPIDVAVNGGTSDDVLTIDLGLANTFADLFNPSDLSIVFDGGAGIDALIADAAHNQWQITGIDAGNVSGLLTIDFSGVENLTGAVDNEDTFVLRAGGDVNGILEGGDRGFDSLIIQDGTYQTAIFSASGPDAGTIELDGILISYAGLEPIDLATAVADLIINADTIPPGTPDPLLVPVPKPDNLVLEGAAETGSMILRNAAGVTVPTIEEITFVNPTNSLTINLGDEAFGIPGTGDDILTLGAFDPGFNAELTVNGDGGADTVVIAQSLTLPGRDIEINAESITVIAGVTISTEAGAGASGDIRLTAISTKSLLSPLLPTPAVIVIGDMVSLLADGGTSSGHIVLNAMSEQMNVDFPQIAASARAEVAIFNATLRAGSIGISAFSEFSGSAEGVIFATPVDAAIAAVTSIGRVAISGGSELVSDGTISIAAGSTVFTKAESIARSSAVVGNTAIDAAVASSVVVSEAIAHISGTTTVSAGEAVNLAAFNSVNVETIADGIAGGANAAGGSIAISTVTANSLAFFDESATLSTGASLTVQSVSQTNVVTTARATAQGATEPTSPDDSVSPVLLADFNAHTSEGLVQFAAAFAVAAVTSDTQAYIESTGPVTASGSLEITATSNTDSIVLADGSAVGPASAGTAIAVAINVPMVTTAAYIGGTGAVSASDITVQALMTDVAGDVIHTFSSEAISGAGTSDAEVGVAGALAHSIVATSADAYIGTGSTVDANGGNVLLSAANTSGSATRAVPEGDGAVGSEGGVGGSAAFHIASNLTRAQLQSAATLNNANDFLLTAIGDHESTTEAEAGAQGGTAVTPAAAVTIADNDTLALIGIGPALSVTGNVAARAVHRSTSSTRAQGDAEATPGGQGGGTFAAAGAIALNAGLDEASASIARDVHSPDGDVAVAADSTIDGRAEAVAGVGGAQGGTENVMTRTSMIRSSASSLPWAPGSPFRPM